LKESEKTQTSAAQTKTSFADRWKQQSQQEPKKVTTGVHGELASIRKRADEERRDALGQARPSENQVFSDKDVTLLLQYINFVLQGDQKLKQVLPLRSSDLTKSLKDLSDGMVLCKFMDKMIPDMLDQRVINYKIFDKISKMENWNLCVNTGKACGCRFGNISPNDLEAGKKEALVEVIWQIIKASFDHKLKSTNKHDDQLELILETHEELDDVKRLSVDDIILRWVNVKLAKVNHPRKASNIAQDFRDSELYILLFHSVAPSMVDKSILKLGDTKRRAEKLVDILKKFKYPGIIDPESIAEGVYWVNLVILGTLLTTSH